jgi:(p)ppGpp synthase/HD superfamily hydrolase
MTLVEKAEKIAREAHAKQKRKYTGEPYIVHLDQVVAILKTAKITNEHMLAAAWVHDTVEDCGLTYDFIERELGPQVRELVYWLTDVSTRRDGNRATRKAIDRAHLSIAPPEAKTIKLADVICNIETIVKYDPDFSLIYLPEKKLLLRVLTEGDVGLWRLASGMLKEAMDLIGVS